MTSLTRGPLPARVYWVRRGIVLLLLVLLLVALVRIVGALTGGDETPQAVQTAADPAPTAAPEASPSAAPTDAATDAPTAGASAGPTAEPTRRPDRPRATRTPEPVPAQPDGPCDDGELEVVPSVTSAVAGGEVAIDVAVRSLDSEACTWTTSARELTLKITSGDDEIWTTRECRRAVVPQDVVVRSAEATTVEVVWSGRRSDAECTRAADWALPGWYHVAAAAIGGEPTDVQFRLLSPVQEAEQEAQDEAREGGRPQT